jgi:formylglycine-generating enzyme required for sulfatase activity
MKGTSRLPDREDMKIIAVILLLCVSVLIATFTVGSFLYGCLSPVVQRWFGRREPSAGPVPPGVPTKPAGEITNSLGMKLRLIPAGAFDMGSGPSDKDARPEEKVDGKKHRVRITRPFYMAQAEVTVAQFRQFETEVRPSPGFPQGNDHPVVDVSWNDAVAFCNWLSQREGHTPCYGPKETLDLFGDGYRLPTEAEWEYCCRAGRSTVYYPGDDPNLLVTVGNVADEDGQEAAQKDPELRYRFVSSVAGRDGYGFTAPVGRFPANAFRLRDMHGNVEEWCSDCRGSYGAWNGVRDDPIELWAISDERVIRGGSWRSGPASCRSAARSSAPADHRADDLGFRVVRQLPGDRPRLKTGDRASYVSSLFNIRAGMGVLEFDGFRKDFLAILAARSVTSEEVLLAADGLGRGGPDEARARKPGRVDQVAAVLRALDGWTVDDVRFAAEQLRSQKDPDRFLDSHGSWRWSRMIALDVLSAKEEKIYGTEVGKPLPHDRLGLGPQTRRCLVVRLSLSNLSHVQTAYFDGASYYENTHEKRRHVAFLWDCAGRTGCLYIPEREDDPRYQLLNFLKIAPGPKMEGVLVFSLPDRAMPPYEIRISDAGLSTGSPRAEEKPGDGQELILSIKPEQIEVK